jgi:uncharacterized protein involved in exopolysaccharide biosynthesis
MVQTMTVGEQQDQRRAEPREVRMLDLVAIVLERWKIVAAALGLAVLLAVILMAVQPDRYTARTVLLVSQEQGGGRGQFLAQQAAAFGMLGIGGVDGTQNTIKAILKSQTLRDTVVNKVAHGDSAEALEVRYIVARHIQIQTGNDGSITIDVTASNPRRAAAIANQYADAINAIAAGMGAHTALRRQQFLEAQIVGARERLLESEQRLVSFQQGGTGSAQTDAAAERTLDAASRMQQEIITQELHVAQLARTLTPDNPEYRAAVAELAARREQLRRLTSGGGNTSVFVPLRESPQLRVSTLRLLRELEKDQEIYKSLTAAAAEAQIAANNTLPVVSVLDPAVIPGPRAPNVGLILTVWIVTGLMIGLAAAFVSAYLAWVRHNPESEPLVRAWDRFKRDVRRTLPRKNKPGVAQDAA